MSLFSPRTSRSTSFARPVLTLFAALCVAQAAPAQQAQPALLAPADQKALDEARALAPYDKLWRQPLDWEENDASLRDVAEHIQTLLEKDAPRIEVRTKDPLRSTFALPKAPLGETLVSLARLANCRVWAFAGHIVIAPETALTKEEAAAVKARTGGDWKQSAIANGSSAGWSSHDALSRASLRIIGADLKAHLAAKGQTEPAAPPPPPAPIPRSATGTPQPPPEFAPYELPFGELSPAAQRVMQDLLSAQLQRFGGSAAKDKPAPTLAPEVVVGFDDTQPTRLRLFLRGTDLSNYQTQWNLNN